MTYLRKEYGIKYYVTFNSLTDSHDAVSMPITPTTLRSSFNSLTDSHRGKGRGKRKYVLTKLSIP